MDIATIQPKSFASNDWFLSAMSVETRRLGARLAGPIDPPVGTAQVNPEHDQHDDREGRDGEGRVLPLALGREPSPLGARRRAIEPRPQRQHAEQESGQQYSA